MLTDAQAAAVNRIRLPKRYAFQISGKTLDLSCVESPSAVIEVALTSNRSLHQTSTSSCAVAPPASP